MIVQAVRRDSRGCVDCGVEVVLGVGGRRGGCRGGRGRRGRRVRGLGFVEGGWRSCWLWRLRVRGGGLCGGTGAVSLLVEKVWMEGLLG